MSSVFTLFYLACLISNTALFLKPVAALGHHHIHRVSHEKQSESDANHLSIRQASTSSAGQSDYTCGPDRPCSNSACCGESGWCGYSPTYCGKGCQSNCNATAECGQFATTPGAACPLNVCCSEFGFCGTTSEFCGDGCQSHCDQPKPSGPPSNVQKRIIGYWEAWNSQHSCGTMDIGEIPVRFLTHLNVAFGYISQDFKITNMDGISTTIYRNIGNLKARNPNLKISISLGGWAFSDPGPWRNVFPAMTSTRENRATFIHNLLGFLSEYGYDGVDLDWEYPGAGDRGGSDADTANYVALLQELREAIDTSGQNYIVTFTAPTSYWYLRHFDIKSMATHVDWINLMSYDLHGVWDSSNPIGSQLLAHTNLTEIDLALDLFWRAGVDASAIVMGLAFYGRTFKLQSSSCWKPGCTFSGPGDAGSCTGSAGILSYREVQAILDKTGATSYLDKNAAVRYLVYGNASWVSFDDDITFQAKINYANNMGLSGLMIWALDLDDGQLGALRAVSGGMGSGQFDDSFNLVDLKYLFPTQQLPSSSAKPSYGLVTFGSGGDLNNPGPSSGPFGFFLVTGESHAVANLKRRDGEPEPFIFLDCPSEISAKQKDKIHIARVACFNLNLEGCFRIVERGVEGTIVEMPDDCGRNLFGRAIALEISLDQSLPLKLADRRPSSLVYDFSFDFNLALMRRDATNTSFRLDYSNVGGYWDHIVDAPGIQARDVNVLNSRFFAPTDTDWNAVFENDVDFDWAPEDATLIKEDVSAPLFWQTAADCGVNEETFSEGFGAFVQGNVDAQFWFGFSMIATFSNGAFNVDQAHGFLKAKGQTDLTYGLAGMGDIDISQTRKGNPAFSDDQPVNLKGHAIDASSSGGLIALNPYYQITYQMATINGSQSSNFANGVASFNGRLTTRIITDLGDFAATFPPSNDTALNIDNGKRQANKISIPGDNFLYGSYASGGQIAIGTYLTFGLKVEFLIFGDLFKWTFDLPKMELVYNTMEVFSFFPGDPDIMITSCAEYEVITNIYQSVENPESLGWHDVDPEAERGLAYDRQSPDDGRVCWPNKEGSVAKRNLLPELPEPYFNSTDDLILNDTSPDAKLLYSRQGIGSMAMPGWGYGANSEVNPNNYVAAGDGSELDRLVSKFVCANCYDCNEDRDKDQRCCGCINMNLVWAGNSDMPPCPECDQSDGQWPGDWYIPDMKRDLSHIDSDKIPNSENTLSSLQKRRGPLKNGDIGIGTKSVTVCGQSHHLNKPYRYPNFPKNAMFQWDGVKNGIYDPISRYWGNSSSVCINWNVGQLQPADKVYVPQVGGGMQLIRAPYETEHVFEGQVIGIFLSDWLDKGTFDKRLPPATGIQKLSCADTEQFITIADSRYPWKLDGEDTSFLNLLLSELGSESHLDRLSIMLARLNGQKGRLFSATDIVDQKKYQKMGQDEQLQVVKDLGILFNYLNTPSIWDKFCATYEAIYDHMGDFDAWYAQIGASATAPSLQDEWKEFIRVLLDSIVLNSRAYFDILYGTRKYGSLGFFFNAPYSVMWLYNRVWNRGYIKLTGTCKYWEAPRV